jgi:DNA replication protein DnaC
MVGQSLKAKLVVVLVLDDWAMAPITETERRDLLEILENRCGTRSTIVTSQVPPNKWHPHRRADPTRKRSATA